MECALLSNLNLICLVLCLNPDFINCLHFPPKCLHLIYPLCHWLCLFLVGQPGEHNFSFYLKPKGLLYLWNPSAFSHHIVISGRANYLLLFCLNSTQFLSQHLSPFITFILAHVSPPPRLCFWKEGHFSISFFQDPVYHMLQALNIYLLREWWAWSYENVGFDIPLSYRKLFKFLV